MTLQTAVKSASIRVLGSAPTAVFSGTDQVSIELLDLVQDVAVDIAASHDWRALTKVATITGNGALNYQLPIDYSRMLLGAEVDDAATWFWGYEGFASVNEWMRFKSGTYSVISPGGWIILGGELQFYPAPSGNAQFPYISKNWAMGADTIVKPAFTQDDDAFVLSERLLTLGLIWRYRAQKGLDYTEDMQTYETALSQAQGRDKGASVLRTPSRHFGSAKLAYSGRAIW